MMLCGIPVDESHVVELAGMLRDAGHDDTSARLERAQERQTKLLALSIDEREQILSVLLECPDGLAELRGVLLQEHVWRQREGLV